MKTLKLDHDTAQDIARGVITATWRIYDDKDVSVNDEISFMDKVDPQNPNTWATFATANVDSIIEKRLGDIIEDDYGGTYGFASEDEMLMHFRQRYGPQVDANTPVKIIKFTLKEIKNEDNKATLPSIKEAKLFADGGSRGNPGPSSSGFALMDMNDQVFVKKGLYLGITTNNQAEYQALKFGLEEAIKYGIQELHIYMDSLLVVNQMRGVFKVKNRDLWPIHESIKALLPRFKHVSFTHVPRELNKIADGMVNEAMDAAASTQ
jgi:ribonuclease HI